MAADDQRGIALMAVLFALTLLMLLALPFAVSMGVGAEAANRDVEQVRTEQASASVRDLLLMEAATSHPTLDPDPHFDGLDEWPSGVELPDAFAGISDGGRMLLGGEVTDLQRYLSLDAASPLLLANVIGTATRLSADLEADATAMVVDDASSLPDRGHIWIAGEVCSYEEKDGNSLLGLVRDVFGGEDREDEPEGIAEQSLVLDYRCVLACVLPHSGASAGGEGRSEKRTPYRAVGELARVADEGLGGFTSEELDAFQRVFSVNVRAETAAIWGRPERVFNDLVAGETFTMMVKSAAHMGAGSIVRIRSLADETMEYGLLMRAATQRAGRAQLQLPSVFQLSLLGPVEHDFAALDTVVEPLIPPPVNLNTASEEVLAAVFSHVRRSGNLRINHDNNRRSVAPPNVAPQQAQQLAAEIVQMRAGGDAGMGPLVSWQDLVERVFKPRLEAENNNQGRNKWLDFYRALRTGRDSVLEMGTAPIGFQSGPWVRYRAAASVSRSLVAPGVVGRHERSGLAAVVPGFTLERTWETQQDFERAFVLDRRSPFWVTTPINLGHLQPGSAGNDPAARYFPHLIPVAYPTLGLGAPRYALDDPADAGVEPAVAMIRPRNWPNTAGVLRPTESFAQAINRRGRDVAREGPYVMNNTGPTEIGGQPQTGNDGRHDRIAFPFSEDGGFMRRFAAGFWVEPQSLENVILFDHNDGDNERNRFTVLGRDGNLLVEVIDEAGLDPNPADSPAGVQRTASQMQLPLADLGLPSDTPVHIMASAPSGRPGDMSLFVDGVQRGQSQFVTYLSVAVPPFDPTLANNQVQPGQSPLSASGNERFLELQVESTEGFPPVGILRCGLELFEYSAINGNSFQCVLRDSLGGRGARQRGREFRPQIPTDPTTGEPTVDFNDPQFDGVNLDVFPEHPAGTMVELYGYSAMVSEDIPLQPGQTSLEGSVGSFAVARVFVNNSDQISISPLNGPPIPVGQGITIAYNGELELADPVPTGDDQPPANASNQIADAFPLTGGYALLMQERLGFEANIPGQATSGVPAEVGGIELISYQAREGTRLTGVQRAVTLPGDDQQINGELYDATPRQFVTDWAPNFTLPDGAGTWDDVPGRIVWCVPVSLPVQNVSALWDPAATGLTEWMQLLPQGAAEDLEWVRYDTIADNRHVVRGNRTAWNGCYTELTRSTGRQTVQVGNLGPNEIASPVDPPWGTVDASAGFIGYTPQLENQFPQIFYARRRLAFRGDSFTGTSSHAQDNAQVTQCHRIQLLWGNYGGYTGRVGRHDRVALVNGQTGAASGSNRPSVEWHTATWSARRWGSDNLQQNRTPPELFGADPFQLIAFTDEVRGAFIGPPDGTIVQDPRLFDRIVKFPSGELPAAFCPSPSVGGGASGGEQPVQGIVDEVEIVQHFTADLVVDEIMTDAAQTLTTNPNFTNNSAGAIWSTTDLSASYPQAGGLIQVDDEIMAYSSVAAGVFQIAQNGRGLLNTEPRAHDRGARLKFLTQRPAAILTNGVSGNEAVLTVQDLGPLPSAGTLLLGQELLHYCWSRRQANTLEMPTWYPPNPDGTVQTDSAGRGLFRGRYGTAPQSASANEVVILWPTRHWDRYAEASDDPELAYFQFTTSEAPVFFRSLRWRQETLDARVQLLCRVRTDNSAPWSADASSIAGMWEFTGPGTDGQGHRLNRQGQRLEIRFQTVYRPGAIDLSSFRAHGWKTSARVENLRLDFEGESRIFDEEVTAR
ncbi:MAG: hypothetical protein AB8H80_03285 [Planctomycetota bacterium]